MSLIRRLIAWFWGSDVADEQPQREGRAPGIAQRDADVAADPTPVDAETSRDARSPTEAETSPNAEPRTDAESPTDAETPADAKTPTDAEPRTDAKTTADSPTDAEPPADADSADAESAETDERPLPAPPGQSIPLPGQVPNTAGGAAWVADPWTRLNRYLILGTEGGTFYATEGEHEVVNLAAVRRCLAADGPRVVRTIAAISDAGRAPRNTPALTALAEAAAAPDPATRRAALAALPQVARTGSHLFEFAAALRARRGWGRGARQAIAGWYNARDPRELTYQAIKYQQRNGWSHRDLLRLSHPTPATYSHQVLYHWVTQGWPGIGPEPHPNADVRQLWALEATRRASSPAEVARLIREHRLPREAVPTAQLVHGEVWEALLDDLPMSAMLRNLPTLTRTGVLRPGGETTRRVAEQLTERGRLRAARVHPIHLLTALNTYRSGTSLRGTAAWTPVPEIVDALESSFYLAFDAVIPANTRWLIGLDVSGSMGTTVAGGLSARDVAAAMALVTTATEPEVRTMAFASDFQEFSLSRHDRLASVIDRMQRIPFGPTDCAQPMIWARERRIAVDTFAIYTDSETWVGAVHPARALADYRQAMGIPARLVVVATTANRFTIADPEDAGMLDVVGFDPAAPALISDFARGEV